jgi:hypothetical protein
MGGRAAQIVHDQFQQDEMIEQFCNVIARGLPDAKRGSA